MVAIRRGSATAAGMRGTRMNRPAQSEVHRGDTPTGGRQLGRAAQYLYERIRRNAGFERRATNTQEAAIACFAQKWLLLDGMR